MIALNHRNGSLSLGKLWQMSYPAAAGIVVFCIILSYGPIIYADIAEKRIDVSGIYTAIAGLFAIITGFLANFYCTIQSLTDTRLKRVARTRVFQRYISYIKECIVSGIFVAAGTIPDIIFSPTVSGWSGRFLVAVWFGFSTYSLGTFVRIAGVIFFIFDFEARR